MSRKHPRRVTMPGGGELILSRFTTAATAAQVEVALRHRERLVDHDKRLIELETFFDDFRSRLHALEAAATRPESPESDATAPEVQREPETSTAQNPGWLCSVHNSPGEAGDCCCAHALDFGPCGDCRTHDQPIAPATATESTQEPTGENVQEHAHELFDAWHAGRALTNNNIAWLFGQVLTIEAP